MQGEIHQRKRNHQAGQRVQQVRQTLSPDRQFAFIAHHQQADRHGQYQAQRCTAQGQRQRGQKRFANFCHWKSRRRTHGQPVAEHAQRNPTTDDRQCQAVHLAEWRPLAQSNLLGMPRRALADTYMSALAAHAQFQPQQGKAHHQQYR